MHIDLLIINASQIATPIDRGRPCVKNELSDISIIENGAIAIHNGKILDVGRTNVLMKKYSADVIINAENKLVIPGFVDPHTHLLFAGYRDDEFVLRLKGISYMEIHKRGGGILRTVRMVRKASETKLADETIKRITRMILNGTTTFEIKSGYGLDTKNELKMLRAIKKIKEFLPVDVIPTFLGAHAIPENMSAEEYVKIIIEEMIPKVAKEKLAVFNDVFIEGGFTYDQCRSILLAGKEHGLIPKVHADEFRDANGAKLAAETNAISADHLVNSSEEGLRMLASKKVCGVLLPATSMSVGSKFANARKMINLGIPIALGTDLSPACLCESMQMVITLAIHFMKMLPEEALTAATLNAAYAIGLRDRGSLEKSKRADIIILDIPRINFLGYLFGGNLVTHVIVNGKILVEDGKIVSHLKSR